MNRNSQLSSDYEVVRRSLCQFLHEQVLAEGVNLDEDSVLSELGVDSFSLMELLLFLERELGVSLPMEKLTPDNIHSVRALAECIVSLSRK